MIEIDGSIGYGQVLRTAIALSALVRKPIRIYNIRMGRPKPGLRPQHLTGVRVAGELCGAKVKGLEIGSTEVEFLPGVAEIPKHKTIDIGTAGSIGLLLQTLTPLLIFVEHTCELELIGGTAGLGAPPVAYIQHVTFSVLSKLGLPKPEIEIIKYGFYPKGGGMVKVVFRPVESLKAVKLTNPGRIKAVHGLSIAGSLPAHIAERQAAAAEQFFAERKIDAAVEPHAVRTLSPGTCITLWAECENSVLGADALGELGVRAELVGQRAAESLWKSIKSQAALDRFMADQIVPFMALAEGRSEVKVEKLTEHCLTNIAVTEKLLGEDGVKFEVDRERKRIIVEGIGYRRE